MNESFKEMVIPLIYPALIIIILIFAFLLYIISKNFQTKLNRTWRTTKVFECEELHIFLAKASAYRNGAAVILKNNTPRYVLIEFSQIENEQASADEDVLAVSKRLMAKNREAYEVLAE